LSETAVVYSARLGAIRDAQLDAAAQRLGIGRFVAAAPVTSGLFGQNLFLTTTEGEFVLRGAPHWVNGAPNDAWQFTKETFFARLLHERTDVPVPWPMLHDTTSDIFGWPYLVMPRMPGIGVDVRTAARTLAAEDRLGIAAALGETLARLQRLRWPVAGEIDPTCAFAAYPAGHARHLADEILAMADLAAAHGAFDAGDRDYVAHVVEAGCRPELQGGEAVYVHADYTLGNLVVDRVQGAWTVTGVFDFHTSCMGVRALDLCRQTAAYLDHDPPCADVFVAAWRERSGAVTAERDLVALCAANERLKIWEYFTRPGQRADWIPGRTFRSYAAPYVARVSALVDGSERTS
jgi:aminoglycoside phosphotransferase (APT) family kinase protein